MLKITTANTQQSTTLCLEGSLRGPWVYELQRVWHLARSCGAHRPLRADLEGVRYIDEAGKRLLAAMFKDGVELIASGPMMSVVVQEIAGQVPAGAAARGT